MTWVIPCYNEAARLDRELIVELSADPRVRLVMVDDGSADETRALLDDIAAAIGERATAVSMARNSGKAEAVRHGLLRAIDAGATHVGYLDADFSTPPGQATALVDACLDHDVQVVLGARIARLGAYIERKPWRHYLGRVFATVASLTLDLPVYDTQCGAKVFRVGSPLRAALAEPFQSSWAFDVELIGRLLDAGLARDDFLEVPLTEWCDVGGSKMGVRAMWRGGMELLKLARKRRLRLPP